MISTYVFLQEFLNPEDFNSFVDNYSNKRRLSYTDTILELKNEAPNPNTIDGAFTWEDTYEGHDYWGDINYNFVDSYSDNLKQIEDRYLNLLPI